MNVIVTVPAEIDLEEITLRIARRNPDAALRISEDLRERVLMLEANPGAGRLTKEPGIRELVLGDYVLPYRVQGDVVYVLRVLHGRNRP